MSPESVIVLTLGKVVEPKAIICGLKEQVPGLHARRTESVKVLGPERDIVKVVLAVPMGCNCVRVGELRLKTGFPVPVKVIAEVPAITLSVTTRPPLRVPVAVGVKVIWKAQLPFWGSVNGVAGQLLVSEKSPFAVILVTVKGVSPLLTMITVWGGLVTFKVSAGNTRLLGVNSTVVAPVMPVPVSVTR